MILVKKRRKVKPLILDLKFEVFRLLDKILGCVKPLHITAGAYEKDTVLDTVALKNFYKSCGFKKFNKTKEGLIEMKLRKKAFKKIEV